MLRKHQEFFSSKAYWEQDRRPTPWIRATGYAISILSREVWFYKLKPLVSHLQNHWAIIAVAAHFSVFLHVRDSCLYIQVFRGKLWSTRYFWNSLIITAVAVHKIPVRTSMISPLYIIRLLQWSAHSKKLSNLVQLSLATLPAFRRSQCETFFNCIWT